MKLAGSSVASGKIQGLTVEFIPTYRIIAQLFRFDIQSPKFCE